MGPGHGFCGAGSRTFQEVRGSRILRGFKKKRRAGSAPLAVVVRFLGCLGQRLDVPELGQQRVLIVVAAA